MYIDTIKPKVGIKMSEFSMFLHSLCHYFCSSLKDQPLAIHLKF